MKHEAIAPSPNSGINTSTGEGVEVSTLSEHKAAQVERANASGATPVVFVHGLWLLPLELGPLGDAVRGGRLRGVDTGLAWREVAEKALKFVGRFTTITARTA